MSSDWTKDRIKNHKKFRQKYDTINSNGFLEKQEVRNVLADYFNVESSTIPGDFIDEHFRLMDKDSSGRISFRQYYDWVLAHPPEYSDIENQLDYENYKKWYLRNYGDQKSSNLKSDQNIEWNFKNIDKANKKLIRRQDILAYHCPQHIPKIIRKGDNRE